MDYIESITQHRFIKDRRMDSLLYKSVRVKFARLKGLIEFVTQHTFIKDCKGRVAKYRLPFIEVIPYRGRAIPMTH